MVPASRAFLESPPKSDPAPENIATKFSGIPSVSGTEFRPNLPPRARARIYYRGGIDKLCLRFTIAKNWRMLDVPLLPSNKARGGRRKVKIVLYNIRIGVYSGKGGLYK
jgi:hypothetical protein